MIQTMRPIDKGSWPTKDSHATRKRVFNDWTRAIPYLKGRTGRYCHLCELKVSNAMAIEHIKSKKYFPRLQAHWDNFLLICNHCNSHKLATITISPYKKTYYWPHLNNTIMAFDFRITGEIIPNRTYLTTKPQIDRANATIDLYGLDKVVTAQGNSDDRLKDRLEAYKQAIDRFIEFSNSKASVHAIVDNAKNTGFFSVWLKVFNSVPNVKAALIDCLDFHLATTYCFNSTYQPIPRNPTFTADPI